MLKKKRKGKHYEENPEPIPKYKYDIQLTVIFFSDRNVVLLFYEAVSSILGYPDATGISEKSDLSLVNRMRAEGREVMSLQPANCL